jgi:hypothetical protein
MLQAKWPESWQSCILRYLTCQFFSELYCSFLINSILIMELFELALTFKCLPVQKLNFFTRIVQLLNTWAYCPKMD